MEVFSSGVPHFLPPPRVGGGGTAGGKIHLSEKSPRGFSPYIFLVRQENRKKNKTKQYKPKMYMTLGNHEDRINRATNASPELDGAISINDLQYKKFGWKCTPFKQSITVKNITFSHYFTTGVSGRPISSVHVGHALISKLHCSSVQGHSHLYNHSEQTRPDGQKIFGLSGGCYSHPNYSENWCKDTEHQWWRGVIMLEGLDGEGYYDAIRAVTQRKIMG